jgi:hypothetical protein
MSDEITAEDQATMFEFLDELRDSGAINMMGAAEPLAEYFDIPKRDAREVLFAWMKLKR